MNFVTHADVINKLVIPKQGFDNFIIHDEINDNLTSRHIELLEKINRSFLDGKNYFLYLHYSKIHTGIMNEVLIKRKTNQDMMNYFAMLKCI